MRAVPNNSLIVECGDRSRYVSYNDIYVQEADIYSYSYTTSFDGEGAITSAIDYVHPGRAAPALSAGGSRRGGAALHLRRPGGEGQHPDRHLLPADGGRRARGGRLRHDLRPHQRHLHPGARHAGRLCGPGGQAAGGGRPTEEGTLENLYSLLSDYGVTAQEGVVVEGDREHYAFQMPYVLLPDMASSNITDPLIEENYYVFMPIAQGLTVESTSSATSLLTTSDAAFSKADGYDLTTYEKEEGDTDGPFALAVSVESSGGGQMIWFASSYFLDDMYNAYSSGANVDLGMNALSSLHWGRTEAMAIRSKSLNYNYLTISDAQSSLLKTMMIGVCPLVYLGIGIAVVLVRRRIRMNGLSGCISCWASGGGVRRRRAGAAHGAAPGADQDQRRDRFGDRPRHGPDSVLDLRGPDPLLPPGRELDL